MPKAKLFVSKRHARRRRKNAIHKLMTVINDDATDSSSDNNSNAYGLERSNPSSSNSNFCSDDFEVQFNEHDYRSECYSPNEETAHNSSDLPSVPEQCRSKKTANVAVYEDFDGYDSNQSVTNPEYEINDVTNLNMDYGSGDEGLCSSGDSSYNGEPDYFRSSNEETYTFTVNPSTFRESFKNLMAKHNATLALNTDLLHLLHPILPFLPLDGRTLLQTPRSTEITKLANGEMCYFGLETCMHDKLKERQLPIGHVIQLDFNIDGLPLFKSSSTEFWPILGRICSIDDQEPFAIAIFCGQGKPEPKELFLSQFIDEVQTLQKNGIKHDNAVHEVTIRCFACDAPARSWLKCIKAHSAKAGCERCTTLATFKDKKLFYPTTDMDCTKRRDEDFRIRRRERKENKTKHTKHDKRQEQQAEHITGKSPLLKILILGLVTQFILDSMHLVYLGVTKRLALKYWVGGRRPFKFSMQNLQIINNIIRTMRTYIPSDFARKGRSLLEIKRLKATELRLILLYTGPVFLHDVLSEDKYSNFLLLHAAITILSSKAHMANYIQIAREALKKFVSGAAEIYGNDFVVYNVHSLLHLADDVENYGPLDDYSCFPFENYLKTLKFRVRAKTCPLQQIANRIHELNSISTTRDSPEAAQYYPIGRIGPSNHHADEQYFECTSLKCHSFKISSSRPDNVVFVNGNVHIVKKIFCIHGQYKFIGTSFRFMEDLYKDPLPSSELNISYCRSFGGSFTFPVDQISFKCLMVPFKQGFAIFPILHQL